jgi:hypothetical protein
LCVSTGCHFALLTDAAEMMWMVLQPTVKNLINGAFVESSTKDWIDVTNPVRRNIFS